MNKKNYCKAAFSQTNITPDFPVEMIGCYREDQRPNGVFYPLYAQVLLFEFQGSRNCVITIDNLGFTIQLSQKLRNLIAEVLDMAPSNIMICYSHTHSSPEPTSSLNGQRYFHLLCERLMACARDAMKKLQPCLIGWAVGETGIGENRREGCSIVDRRLGGIQVVNAASGEKIALLLRVCAHANILMTKSNKLSSDYFGAARNKIAAQLSCPVMIIQGASGNIKPLGVKKIGGGDPSDVERISDILTQSALQLRFQPSEVTRLFMLEKEIHMHSDVPTEKEALLLAKKSGMNAKEWLKECKRLQKEGVTQQIQNRRIQFFFLNEGCLCGVSDEIFCEISLEVVKQTCSPLVFFNGYTNACTGYLAHAEEWIKGGYEIFDSFLTYFPYHGHVMPFRQETAQTLVDEVVKTWNAQRQA